MASDVCAYVLCVVYTVDKSGGYTAVISRQKWLAEASGFFLIYIWTKGYKQEQSKDCMIL